MTVYFIVLRPITTLPTEKKTLRKSKNTCKHNLIINFAIEEKKNLLKLVTRVFLR